jgi:monofunctional biosynthetic peptidoglycan transglycosylase
MWKTLTGGFLLTRPAIPSSIRKWLYRIPVILLLLQILAVLSLRWIDPPSSAFIRQDRRALRRAGLTAEVEHEWVDLSRISRNMQLAVIAAEDQKFPRHFGFDLPAIREVMEQRSGGRPARGASTITQQVAKNLYLWPGRNLLRKGLEAWLTLWIELLWSKDRILEIYLNLAQFDDHIYGVGAAAPLIFGRSAADLSRYQSAMLAAVLPDPAGFSAARPTPYLYSRALWIQDQMRQLGDKWLDQ